MTYHRYNIGAIEDIGVSPYQIAGDPVMALIAQLNRFAGRTIKLPDAPGCRNSSRNYLPSGPLPLSTSLNDKSAVTANLIMYDRLQCVAIGLVDMRKLQKVIDATENPMPHVQANLNDYTTNIAQFADSLGLPAAKVGITTVDPKVAPKFPVTTVLLLGGLALAAVFFVRRK